MAKLPHFAQAYIDLAQPRLGAEVLSASDDFFAAKERLIKPQEPIFIADKYDDHGKWMDGWESRRRRDDGHDHCVIRICPGIVHGVDIDTRHFTGNYPPGASLEACWSEQTPTKATQWHVLLGKTALQGDRHHYIAIDSRKAWTHLRLNIYPDGGIARLRVYGEAYKNWAAINKDHRLDLAAMDAGGRTIKCNDMHFGHMCNLIAPGRGCNMGDGWETRRRRTDGHDWVILKLAHRGVIDEVEVDTAFFKGNYPSHCAIYGASIDPKLEKTINAKADCWQPVLPKTALGPDQIQRFSDQVITTDPITHVLFNIYPDGGVSRLRLYGHIADL